MKSSNIGGQAVMEGIMMRHKDKYAIAVRRPDKEIELKVEDYKCTFGKAAFLKWPIIRGVVSFVDGLVVGTKCLMYSAEIAGDEEDEKEAAKNATLTEEELSAKKAKEAKQFQWLLYITVAISIVVSVAASHVRRFSVTPQELLKTTFQKMPSVSHIPASIHMLLSPYRSVLSFSGLPAPPDAQGILPAPAVPHGQIPDLP